MNGKKKPPTDAVERLKWLLATNFPPGSGSVAIHYVAEN